jgi:hypothetical protein
MLVLGVLFVLKISVQSVVPSSRFENRQKEREGVPLMCSDTIILKYIFAYIK